MSSRAAGYYWIRVKTYHPSIDYPWGDPDVAYCPGGDSWDVTGKETGYVSESIGDRIEVLAGPLTPPSVQP
mgnify:CR=1 FL=1